MAFETTVKKGTVNQQNLPNGDIQVTFAEARDVPGFLGVLIGATLGLMWISGLLAIMISIGLDGGSLALLIGLVLFGVPTYLFIYQRFKISSFTIVPNQGIKHKGEKIAFKDINTITTVYKNNAPWGFNLDVMGGQVQLVAGARDADVTYIRHIFESNSPVKYS